MSGYQKAVPINNTSTIVYAKQFTERKYSFEEIPQMGKGIFLKFAKIHVIHPDDWIVWYPDAIEYEILSDHDFRERFTLYKDCPPAVKAKADKYPSYAEWVEQCNKSA